MVLEMSGVPSAIHQALQLVRVGGRVQMLGIPAKPMDINFASEVIFKGITIYGVVGRRMYKTWIQMTRFLRSGKFDPTPVITHRFPLADFDAAIAAIKSGPRRKGRFRDRGLKRGGCIRALQEHRFLSGEFMINKNFVSSLQSSIQQLKDEKVYKQLNYLESPQSAHVRMEGRGEVLILSSNNYLGLCDEPASWTPGSRASRLWSRYRKCALHLRDIHRSSRTREGARRVCGHRIRAQLRVVPGTPMKDLLRRSRKKAM